MTSIDLRRVARLTLALIVAAAPRTLALAGGDCDPPLTPPSVDLVLSRGESAAINKCVCLNPVPPKVDVCISVDLTSSMSQEANNIKIQILNIINTVRVGTGSEVQFSLVTYEDYPARYTSCGYNNAEYSQPGTSAFRVVAPIGSSDAQVQAGVNAMQIRFGGDMPESYARVLWEAGQPDSGINFRPDALKILVNFGDAVPHDCNLREGLPSGCLSTQGSTGIDPGRDGIIGTPDDIDFQDDALAAMLAANIKLVAIHSGGSAQFCAWANWAARTGGTARQINADGSVPGGVSLPNLVLQVVRTAASIVRTLELRPDAGCPLDISFDPPTRGPINVANGATVCFTETIHVPEDVQIPPNGRICCTVEAFADGASVGTQQVCVTVNDAPSCDAGGPYVALCMGASTQIRLDGRGSSDPDGSPMTYHWTTDCPGASFDDANSVMPLLTISGAAGCGMTCNVTLTVSDNVAPPVSCSTTVSITDNVPPTIHCPANLFVPFGDQLNIDAWLNSATATDNCDPSPEITYELPPGGFPPGTSSPVRWTATDDCGQQASCTALLTIGAPPRGGNSRKGSLLFYPDVELRWNENGELVQDTFLTLYNDFPSAVWVKVFFINGDPAEADEPGWNKEDMTIQLTRDQPVYWSALTGQPAGLTPFTALDPASPLGRPDPDNPGQRMLRGYIVAWAVNALGHEISWNHLGGGAMILDYERKAAWEYVATGFQANNVAHGEEPLDCPNLNPSGLCPNPLVIPGRIDLDGYQYDLAPDRLVFNFFSAGAAIRSRPNNPAFPLITIDTDLTLVPVSVDLRQDNTGPVRTKAKFDIWNQNEVRFSGQERCISCWDQTLLSRYGAPGHLTRERLQTDRGKARIDGLGGDVCVGGIDAALLGVEARLTEFNSKTEYAGSSLVNDGTQRALIRYDILPVQ